MPFQLHTAKGRKGQSYKRGGARKIGSWNADISDGAMPPGDASEMKNWRKLKPTEIEVRTGYKQYPLPGVFVPMATTEYRLDNIFRDVSFFQDGSNLKVQFLDCITGSTIIKTVVTGGITINSKVYAWQYNTYLVFTVYGIGLFSMQPADDQLTAWNDAVRKGKKVASPPTKISFVEKTNGPLIVFDNKTVNSTLTYQYAIGEKEPTKIPIDIGAQYFRADEASIKALRLINQWVFGKDDGIIPDLIVLNARTPELTDHLRTNGFGYKIVYVHEDTDVKGQKFVHRSNPSVDFWVQDTIYCPAFWTQKYTPPSEQGTHFPERTTPKNAPDRWDINANPFLSGGGFDPPVGVPTLADLQILSGIYQSYFKGGTGTGDPYFYVALWLFWTQQKEYDYGTTLGNAVPPYKIAVPASELKSAPMTVFNFADFPNVPSDVVKIEIYRTAYAQPDDKDNAVLSPEFQPYRYGLVGTLDKDGTFTDDVAIPDFGQSPDRYIGYIDDQFSASVITTYGDEALVLGDTISKYYVFPPTNLVQAFAYNCIGNASDNFVPSELIGDAGDGLPQMALYLQYADADGNTSDLTPLTVDISNVFVDNTAAVAIVPPRGYSSGIVTISVWQGKYLGPGREYKLIQTLSLPVTEIYAHKAGTSVAVSTPGRTTVTSHDPGALIWNDGQSVDVWPQENFQRIHQSAPVTGFNSISGMLGVFLDCAYWVTNLQGRKEEVNKEVGLISRWAIAKDQKIVLFLSQFGVYLAEGSGVRPLPSDIETEVLKYLHEDIPGVAPLANARRASMGWLGQREEMWLFFPTSVDIGGVLPQRLFIYKIASMKEVQNYEFDMSEFRPVERVIFTPHTDGSLYSAHQGEFAYPHGVTQLSLIVQNNDAPGIDWPTSAFVEFKWPLDGPEVKKRLRSVMLTAEVHADIHRVIGLARTDGLHTSVHGSINENATAKQLTVRGRGYLQQFRFHASQSIFNTAGYVPVTRFRTEPNAQGEHRARICSIELLYKPDHKKP